MSGPYSLVTVSSGGSSPFSAVANGSIITTAGNWGQTTPTNLANVTDNDLATATGWGQTAGGGNKGYIQVDLGQFYATAFFKSKFGLRMGDNWGGGNATWTIEVADANDSFGPVWIASKFAAGTTELIFQLGFWVSGQKIRFTCEDVAGGPGMLRLYDLRAWSVALP